jgi:hypothetical protein
MNFNKTSAQLVIPAAVIMAAAHLTFYPVGFHEVSNKFFKDLEERLKAHTNHLLFAVHDSDCMMVTSSNYSPNALLKLDSLTHTFKHKSF